VAKHKVLLMTPSLNYGGEELSTINIARELMARGHKVAYMSSGGPIEKFLRRYSIRFVKANINGRGPVGIVRGAAEIYRFLKKEPASIIHAQTPWPALMSRFAVTLSKQKIPVIWHDRGIRRRNYPYMARLANLFFDFVITNSDDEKKLLLACGLSPAKVRRIHNGLNIPDHEKKSSGIRLKLGIDPDAFLVGAIGRMVKEKGFDWLIKAAAELEAAGFGRKVNYLLVGDGPLKAKLQKMAFDMKLGKKIFFAGFTDDVSGIMKDLDVLAVPSEFEPFGNVVLEGMYAGVPVVASKVGGIKEIISDGQDGLLIEPRDPSAIAKAIQMLMSNKELKGKIAEGGRQKVISYFNIKRVINEIEDVYYKITRSI